MTDATTDIYDRSFAAWVRTEPLSLSDFTARPYVFDACGDVSNAVIADLGCGEGYCAREFVRRGAARLDGIDISGRMIEAARLASEGTSQMRFEVGTVTDVPLLSEEYDFVVGVFVFNYLSVAETKKSFKEVYRLLKPGGKFVFCVPHPAFPFIRTEREKPFYFEFDKGGYFKSRDQIQNGKIWKLNGDQLPVQMHHKLLEDFLDALRDARFAKMPHVKELGVTSELAATNPQFFNAIAGVPLHMLMVVEK